MSEKYTVSRRDRLVVKIANWFVTRFASMKYLAYAYTIKTLGEEELVRQLRSEREKEATDD